MSNVKTNRKKTNKKRPVHKKTTSKRGAPLKYSKVTSKETDFIRKNISTMTYKEMAEDLGISDNRIRACIAFLRRNGYLKKRGNSLRPLTLRKKTRTKTVRENHKFIKDNYKEMSDKEMAEHIGVKPHDITTYRHRKSVSLSRKRGATPRQIKYKVLDSGCHECTSHKSISAAGHPVSRKGQGKLTSIAKVMYIKARGNIPAGGRIYRSCKNKKCINPKHMSVRVTNTNVKSEEK